MAKKAKHIENRIRSTSHVKGAAAVHHDQVAGKLAALAVEVQGAGTKATKDVFEIVLEFVGAALDHAGANLDAAEIAVVAEKADDVGLREARDENEVALRNSCIRVKSTVTDALGEKALATYGLEGATPRGARELLTHAQTVVKLLGEKAFQKTVEGVAYDSTAIAASLKAKADTLAKAISDMEREDQELKDKLGLRDAALTSWTEAYQGGADTLVGLFRLAGRKDLAEAVRPTMKTIAGEDVAPEVSEGQTPNASTGVEAPK